MYTVTLKCDVCGEEVVSDADVILSQRPPPPWRVVIARLRANGSVMDGDSRGAMHVCSEACMMRAIELYSESFGSQGCLIADVVMYGVSRS